MSSYDLRHEFIDCEYFAYNRDRMVSMQTQYEKRCNEQMKRYENEDKIREVNLRAAYEAKNVEDSKPILTQDEIAKVMSEELEEEHYEYECPNCYGNYICDEC
jgi:hypothetical protein